MSYTMRHSPEDGEPSVKITQTMPAASHAPDPRIPLDVWNTLQECGTIAAQRLLELLEREDFAKLQASNQAKLISLAFAYAYGAPAKAPTIKATGVISGEQADAVAQSLNKLRSVSTLPEYLSPVSPETPDLASPDGQVINSGSQPPDNN